MFTVLSSWQSHCESSPGSFDAARVYTHHRHLLLLLSPKADWLLVYRKGQNTATYVSNFTLLRTHYTRN